MFQALGVPDRTSVVRDHAYPPLGQGARAPAMEQSGSASAPQPQTLRVPLRPLPPLLCRLSLLRVMGNRLPRIMGNRLPNRRLLVEFLQALLPLAQLVTPVHRRSRRPVTRRAMSPSETPLRLVWRTSFTRSVRIHVRAQTLRVHRAVDLRLGSASRSLRPPSSASGSIPGLRR